MTEGKPWMTKKVIYNPRTKKIIRSFKNVDIKPFYSGLAVIVTNSHKYGMVDTNGILAIDTVYQYLGNFDKFGISAKKNDQSFYMDKNENKLFGKTFSKSESFFIL